MAVTTGSAEPAEGTNPNIEQSDNPVESTADQTLLGTMMTVRDSDAFRTGIREMTALLGNAERLLPNIIAPRGERYAQVAGDTRTDGTSANDVPASEISDEKRKELKDKYGVDVEVKDGKYIFKSEIAGQHRDVFSSDATPEGMEKAIKALDKQEALFKKYGVETYIEDGKYKFTYFVDGQMRDAIQPVDATPDAMDKAEQNLEAQTQSKIKELEKRYKISIEPGGREIGSQEDICRPKGDQAGLPKISTRTPTMGELYALEQALSQSEPSQLHLPGEKPLSVMFIDKSAAVDRDGNDILRGVYFPPEVNKGQGVLVITPSGADAPLTDNDTKGDEESLASTIRHELAHNGQRNLYPKMEVPESTLREMGWIRFPNPDYKPGQLGSQRFNYAIKTTDGRYFTNSGPSCDNGAGTWNEVNSKGQFLDSNGKIVKDRKDAFEINNDELRENALVKPSTNYFNQPLEVLAEGMKLFRGGEEGREALKNENPELFKIIEKVDELERKLRYGVNSNGSAKVQRRPDGTLDR
ncbi:MAG: hypothetical protein K2X81_21195 [Candidatus Obscuribacterales bacterium]|nr:hypothetical protein [Candidatus Obscuribacterales bacterium]